MAREYTYTITKNNTVLAICDSMRSLANEMTLLGKNHIWYSRKLSGVDSFLFVFKNEVYHIQRHKNKS